MCLAIPGKVVRIDGVDPTLRSAQVDFSGVRKEVSLAFTPEAVEGNYVLVHVGFAISVMDEAEAERTLEELRKLGEAEPF
ncbi:MAG TPA: hydrogenase assembly protein HupF [Solibacterales bacterium]|nr:hydrogenase assembly protein HupF [Bryobacterales bacterium]